MITFVYTSYRVCLNIRRHTRGSILLRNSAFALESKKQKLNMQSSTKSELVGTSDVVSEVMRIRLFVEAQDYLLKEKTIY